MDDLVPLYPVYALLFADTGLDATAIASLFVLWSLVSLVAEVPSGALADRIPRRHLLLTAALVRATGFALWVTLPGYPAFAVGFALWGAASALRSGTLEALVYDELRALGAAERYPVVRARTGVAELLADLTATLAAVPLLALGGYPLVGAVSVATCLLQVAVTLTLPPGHPTGGHEGYLPVLRAGLREAAHHRPVRRLVALTAALAGLHAIDEFVPLLARGAGASDLAVPLLVATLTLAAAAGSWLAGRMPRGVGTAMAAAALLVAVAVLADPLAGIAVLAVWYGCVQLARVMVDVRLQDSIVGDARATVTSVAGVGSELAAIVLFAGYGLALDGTPMTVLLLAGVTVPTLPLAAVAARQLRAPRQRHPQPVGEPGSG
ncbi:MAG: MFS transporter [Pseudonocardiaceae bacterium]|nr:MFS transporter [Pseudonocardiaceae bacterium]